MITLFIVDDHSIINQGIKAVLSQYNDKVKVVGTANSGKEALEQLKTLSVDIVFLDIIMPEMDGITCCRHIKKQFPDIKVIGITGELKPEILLKMWREKVNGLLPKTCGGEELLNAITKVLSGRRIIGDGFPPFFDAIEEGDDKPILTRSELEVLKLLGEGHTRPEVADTLFRSVQSIDFHCRNIFSKFKSKQISTVLTEARRARIIS